MPPVEGMPGVIAVRPGTEEYYALRDTVQGTTHEVAVVEHVIRDDFGGISGGDEVAVFVPKREGGGVVDELLDTAKKAAVAGGYMLHITDWSAVRQELTYPRPNESLLVKEVGVSGKERLITLLRKVLHRAS